METDNVRQTLEALIAARGLSFAGVSQLLGKNAAYVQQFIRRGTPKRLDERDRRLLAQFFGVSEQQLGAPADTALPPPHRIPGPHHRTSQRQAPQRSSSTRGLPSRMRLIPRLPVGASAGAGALPDDEAPLAEIAFDEAWLRRLGAGSDAVTMIKVEGDSMAPTLNDGDDILVAMPSDGPARRRDGIHVLRMDDALIVKRLAFRPDGRLSVTSDNALYPSYPDVAPGSVSIVGRVIWAGRRV
ncbi:S24 family peptidase [Blastomonas aquatica]|uniref:Transcriptional regulator n=1 Tax=Blastomonas aquatica TaxID=1510276 RepID=A0ABQ1J5H3_9SPHN|nr:S24 family peptidase [Blastomonas aquatica]GGB60294.1 transcriptional regulator [Blastomonas aquatica]